jgi:hypothetical protein
VKTNYILKENITVEDKSKIYDIFMAADLDVIEAIDGCEEGAGY